MDTGAEEKSGGNLFGFKTKPIPLLKDQLTLLAGKVATG